MNIFGKEVTLYSITQAVGVIAAFTLTGLIVFFQVNMAQQTKNEETLNKAADMLFSTAQKYDADSFVERSAVDAATEFNKENKNMKASVEEIDGGYVYVTVVGFGETEVRSDALYTETSQVVEKKRAAPTKASPVKQSDSKSTDEAREERRAEFQKRMDEQRKEQAIPEVSSEDIEDR